MKRMKDYERESKASAQLYQQLKPQVAFGDVVPLNLREERRAFLETARLHEVGLSSTPPRDPVFRYASDEVAAKMIDSYVRRPAKQPCSPFVRCEWHVSWRMSAVGGWDSNLGMRVASAFNAHCQAV